jgi:hypothetical protein
MHDEFQAHTLRSLPNAFNRIPGTGATSSVQSDGQLGEALCAQFDFRPSTELSDGPAVPPCFPVGRRGLRGKRMPGHEPAGADLQYSHKTPAKMNTVRPIGRRSAAVENRVKEKVGYGTVL